MFVLFGNTVPESFGFRGEALSSISDVSLLEVFTKAHGMPNCYRKVIKGCKCLYLGIDDDRQDVGTTDRGLHSSNLAGIRLG
ncbi:hypothetical protein L1987_43271 [Smallanthus sonchifolius]|uniref:Uncharacterized protein n=1 Tax=Smallanthus sonchifolius TaxID=185202 RepID=A0ACB9GL59_9ASTR|nr:hypothetical protein L1987_43271 [Smallanthus sonchifolius]